MNLVGVWPVNRSLGVSQQLALRYGSHARPNGYGERRFVKEIIGCTACQPNADCWRVSREICVLLTVLYYTFNADREQGRW